MDTHRFGGILGDTALIRLWLLLVPWWLVEVTDFQVCSFEAFVWVYGLPDNVIEILGWQNVHFQG